jgi:hypothetical protein
VFGVGADLPFIQTDKQIYLYSMNLLAMNSFIHAIQQEKRRDNFCLWVGESNQEKKSIKQGRVISNVGQLFSNNWFWYTNCDFLK